MLKSTYISRVTRALNVNSVDELYSQISHGGAFLAKVAGMLVGYYNDDYQAEQKKNETNIVNISPEEHKKDRKGSDNSAGVSVEGVENLLIRFSKCCNPVPGDEIIGFITKGRGISVHRKDCVNIVSLPEEEKPRLIAVHWNADRESKNYNADISIVAEDRKGLFTDLSRTCEDMGVHIAGVNAKSGKENDVNIVLTLSISNTNQMEKVLKNLRSVPGVVNVYRSV